MACPTCDYTLQHVVSSNVRKFYWCSRCGTLKEENLIFKDDDELREGYEVPSLVARVRELLRNLPQVDVQEECQRLGISESVTGGVRDGQ